MAQEVTGFDDVALVERIRAIATSPWPPGDRPHLVRVATATMTGRRVHPEPAERCRTPPATASRRQLAARLEDDLRLRFCEIIVRFAQDNDGFWGCQVDDGPEDWGETGTSFDDSDLSPGDAERLLAEVTFNVAALLRSMGWRSEEIEALNRLVDLIGTIGDYVDKSDGAGARSKVDRAKQRLTTFEGEEPLPPRAQRRLRRLA